MQIIDDDAESIHSNELLKISVNEGGEGVIGMTIPVNGRETFMPFVCGDKVRMESLKPLAIKIAKEANKTIRLIKLDNRKLLETIEP